MAEDKPNREHAKDGEAALRRFLASRDGGSSLEHDPPEHPDDVRDAVVDLIADLLHYLNGRGVADPVSALSTAELHFVNERGHDARADMSPEERLEAVRAAYPGHRVEQEADRVLVWASDDAEDPWLVFGPNDDPGAVSVANRNLSQEWRRDPLPGEYGYEDELTEEQKARAADRRARESTFPTDYYADPDGTL